MEGKAGDGPLLAHVMEKVWRMLADKDIYALLAEPGDIDNEVLKLILIELVSRIKKLEQVNFALQTLLVQAELVDYALLEQTIRNAKDYLDNKDKKKSQMASLMCSSGITFEEWVSFTLQGNFDCASKPANNSLNND